jgi:hypothetical protein
MTQRELYAERFYRYAAQAGFDEEEADRYVHAVIDFLVAKVQTARRADPMGTAYSDVNLRMSEATGQRQLNFGDPADLTFMGAILARVNDLTRDDLGALLSSWVLHKRANLSWQANDIIGVGFYNYVVDRRVYLDGRTLTKNSDAIAREMMLIAHIKHVYAHYHR